MKKAIRNRFVFALVGLFIMSLLFTSCGSSQGAKTGDDEGKKQPIRLTVWHQSVGDADPTSKLITEAIKEWNEAHPDIIVEEDGVTGEQYKTRIKTALAAGEGPDICYMWGGSFVQPYIEAGNLLPIDEYVDDSVLSKLVEGTINGCTYNGKIYSLPMYTFIASLYCNTELFEKAGATIPSTYDELVDAVKKLRSAGITPIVLGEKDRWPGMYWYDIMAMRQAGNEEAKAALKDPSKFNSPDFIEAARKLQELVDLGAFNENMFSMSFDEMVAAFANGEAAMIYQGNWIQASVEDPESPAKGKVVAKPFPVFTDGKGVVTEFYGGAIDGFYINADTPYPKEAAEFLIYFSEKIGKEGYLAGAGLPCWDTEGLDTSNLNPLTVQTADLMKTATSFITWWDNILTAEDSETHKNLIAELLAKKITPEEFCQQMSQVQGSTLPLN